MQCLVVAVLQCSCSGVPAFASVQDIMKDGFGIGTAAIAQFCKYQN